MTHAHPRTLATRIFGNAVVLGLILLRSALMALLVLLRSLDHGS